MIISTSLKNNKNKPVKNLIKKNPLEKPTKTDTNEFSKLIIKEEADINKELLKNYLGFQMPTEMLKTLYNLNDRKKNSLLVNTIKSGLSDLKNKIKEMPEDEIKTKKPYEIPDILEEILEFNELNQQRQGLKIITPH